MFTGARHPLSTVYWKRSSGLVNRVMVVVVVGRRARNPESGSEEGMTVVGRGGFSFTTSRILRRGRLFL